MDLRRSLRFTYTSEHSEILYYFYFNKHVSTANSRSTTLTNQQILKVKESLMAWRVTEYALWVRGLFPTLLPCDFLSNDSIAKLAGAIRGIETSLDLSVVLKPSIDLENSILQRAVPSLLACISSTWAQLPVPVAQIQKQLCSPSRKPA